MGSKTHSITDEALREIYGNTCDEGKAIVRKAFPEFKPENEWEDVTHEIKWATESPIIARPWFFLYGSYKGHRVVKATKDGIISLTDECRPRPYEVKVDSFADVHVIKARARRQ